MTQTRRIFSSHYRTGLVFAPGPGLFIAPLLILPGLALFKSLLIAIVVALGAFAIGALFWTRVRQRDPALVMSPEGLRLEGLWPQPWSQIEGIRPLTDEKGRPAIEMRMRGNVPRNPRSPLWRATGGHTIVIHASLLEDGAAEIEDAFEYFLTARG